MNLTRQKRRKKEGQRRKEAFLNLSSSLIFPLSVFFPLISISSCRITYIIFQFFVFLSSSPSVSLPVAPVPVFSLFFYLFKYLSSKAQQLQEPAGDFPLVGRNSGEDLRKRTLLLLLRIIVLTLNMRCCKTLTHSILMHSFYFPFFVFVRNS